MFDLGGPWLLSSQRVLSKEAVRVPREAVLSVRSLCILQVPKKYSSHSPLMMALEEGQDGDSVVETLLELGASVAFKNMVSACGHEEVAMALV